MQKKKKLERATRMSLCGFSASTFLDSGLGVPSTLLFIFWAGFIFSMPNSELGAIPGCFRGKKKSVTNNDEQSRTPFYGQNVQATIVLLPHDQGFFVAFTHQGCCWPYLLPLGTALALPGSSYRACCSCQGHMESLLPSCPGTC